MRVALGVEYDGSQYFGWQRQKDVDSVQARIEKALSSIANEPIEIICAGRTDSGVHGTGQVVHFDTQAIRKMSAWTLGINAKLPNNIAIRWAQEVDETFHARFSATARRYRYIISNSTLRPGILTHGITHYQYPLDHELMHQGAQLFVGKHDFTSFRALQCQAHSPVRTIEFINITRQGSFIVIDIKANAFLHHMVRNIVGTLLEIGQSHQKVEWVNELLELKDRKFAAPTSKPHGLYLVDVTYPEHYNLPKPPMGPLFMLD
ncbi:tRNA pseudouridine(38-40) synthase TruA [Shewanella donghaensis]|uniref:tRNA pseudouridine(38-40) synthase TruA n=1 Tax=Shewanella donghaensis TaxID=238836 RepID=UPI001182CED5|nr:tRNA pseudouridine(38-40) synthase TruA [Shewanella donghaensis]